MEYVIATKIVRSDTMFKDLLHYYVLLCTQIEFNQQVTISPSQYTEDYILSNLGYNIAFQNNLRNIHIDLVSNFGQMDESTDLSLSLGEIDIEIEELIEFYDACADADTTSTITTGERDGTVDYWIVGDTGFAICVNNLGPFKVGNRQLGSREEVNRMINNMLR